jgi:glycosyltransferase involved in cell wall biosynthesis
MDETIPFASLRDRLAVAHGHPVPGRPTVYSIMRNERFFLEAFFDHYRTLGVGQFLVLDDGSTDGSLDYLRSQRDCVVLGSDLRYGQEIRVRMPDGRVRAERAGVLFKRVIGETFCSGDYGLYADADEFLVLPPAVPDLPTLYARLRERGIDAVVASLVEFYPESAGDLRGTPQPHSFADLLALYPYFDAVPLVRFRPGLAPKRINVSASRRLFARYGITRPAAPLRGMPRWTARLRRRLPGKSATMKTPIVRWREGVWISDTHRSNVRPSSEVLVAFAHFKFNHRLAQKTEEALRLRSYAGKSEKYELYAELMIRMRADDARLMGPDSVRYAGPADFARSGLVDWRLG